MCDFDHGGKTVTSIAGEALPTGTRYWLSCRHESALPHLQWILSLLQRSTVDKINDVRDLAERSIQLSKDKIKNYRRELSRATTRALQNASENELLGQYNMTYPGRVDY